ncbi:MAG: hypothetical protein LBC37_04215 [Zoogloeaceae bacterium]|jgi:hypothetical protein|nr:hypothetical protein [Zoogloeaceae bacterium]
MSGAKRTDLLTSEYQRLMNAASLAENAAGHEAAIRRELASAEASIREQQQASARREREFDKTINQLSEDLRNSAREFQQRLTQQQEAFSRETRRLDERLDQQAQAHRLLAEFTQECVARLDAKEKSAREYAGQWLRDAETIVAYIREHQQHGKFAPGKLAELEQDAATIHENVKREHFEAAISSAQTLYRRAMTVRVEIALAQAEWDAWLAEAEKGAATLLADLDAQKLARWVIKSEDGEQEFDAEIEYWSEGQFTALCQSVKTRAEDLRRNAATKTVDELKQAVSGYGEARAALEKIIEEAKARQFSSIFRFNFAETLAESLEKDGWVVAETAWEGADQDAKGGLVNGYHMKLQDVSGNGDETVTIIAPDNTVRFDYFAQDNNNTRFAANQTRKLNERLHELGLAEGELRCVPGHERTHRGEEQKRDFAAVRARKDKREKA